ESENAKLKLLLADAIRGQVALKETSWQKVLTPVTERETVAHLQACHGMSERRACCVVDADRKSVRYRSGGATMPGYERSCASWRTSAAGSAIAVFTSCCAGRA